MKSDGCVFSPGCNRALLYIMVVCVFCCFIPFVNAADEGGFPETHYWNPYEGWDIDLASVAGIGLFPTVEVDWTPEPSNEPVPKASSDTWVKLAYYPPGSEAGQPAILAGYVGGRNYNADVTITGKRAVSDPFQDIVTIRAQDNGIFVWAVPDSLKSVPYFQAVAKVAGGTAYSEIIQTTGPSVYVPAGSTVPSSSTPVSPATTKTQTESSLPVITSLTLSADTTRPEVGEDVTLSGRLTDSSGKGVSGATITIEVPDYGTDFLPLTTTTTDGDGRFTTTINTYEGGLVPVRAVFEGDDKYMEATSNTLTFSTMGAPILGSDTGSSVGTGTL